MGFGLWRLVHREIHVGFGLASYIQMRMTDITESQCKTNAIMQVSSANNSVGEKKSNTQEGEKKPNLFDILIFKKYCSRYSVDAPGSHKVNVFQNQTAFFFF